MKKIIFHEDDRKVIITRDGKNVSISAAYQFEKFETDLKIFISRIIYLST